MSKLPSDLLLLEVDNEAIEARWDRWDKDKLARVLVNNYELADIPRFFEETGNIFVSLPISFNDIL